jgi:hypothetical protein
MENEEIYFEITNEWIQGVKIDCGKVISEPREILIAGVFMFEDRQSLNRLVKIFYARTEERRNFVYQSLNDPLGSLGGSTVYKRCFRYSWLRKARSFLD